MHSKTITKRCNACNLETKVFKKEDPQKRHGGVRYSFEEEEPENSTDLVLLH